MRVLEENQGSLKIQSKNQDFYWKGILRDSKLGQVKNPKFGMDSLRDIMVRQGFLRKSIFGKDRWRTSSFGEDSLRTSWSVQDSLGRSSVDMDSYFSVLWFTTHHRNGDKRNMDSYFFEENQNVLSIP